MIDCGRAEVVRMINDWQRESIIKDIRGTVQEEIDDCREHIFLTDEQKSKIAKRLSEIIQEEIL